MADRRPDRRRAAARRHAPRPHPGPRRPVMDGPSEGGARPLRSPHDRAEDGLHAHHARRERAQAPRAAHARGDGRMIALLIAVLVTIAVYWLCTAAGLPLIIAGIVALI